MFVLLALACETASQPPFAGTKMSDYFGFDGERSSTFNNDDTSITWQLVIEKKPQTESKDGREVVTMEYTNNATGEVLGSVQWSSVAGEDVQVHGYSLGATGLPISFDPPISITDADDAMRTGDVVESDTTDSNGTAWHFISTYTAPVPECPTTAEKSFVKCVEFTIDDGVNDPATSPLFVGVSTYVAAYGPVYLFPPGYDTQWGLSHVTYTASEDGGS